MPRSDLCIGIWIVMNVYIIGFKSNIWSFFKSQSLSSISLTNENVIIVLEWRSYPFRTSSWSTPTRCPRIEARTACNTPSLWVLPTTLSMEYSEWTTSTSVIQGIGESIQQLFALTLLGFVMFYLSLCLFYLLKDEIMTLSMFSVVLFCFWGLLEQICVLLMLKAWELSDIKKAQPCHLRFRGKTKQSS